MKEYYFIEGRDDLIRDKHSKALIQTDNSILKQEMIRQERKRQKEESEKRLNMLEDQMNRIEKLLMDVLKKNASDNST